MVQLRFEAGPELAWSGVLLPPVDRMHYLSPSLCQTISPPAGLLPQIWIVSPHPILSVKQHSGTRGPVPGRKGAKYSGNPHLSGGQETRGGGG